jgi:hypothetical protein
MRRLRWAVIRATASWSSTAETRILAPPNSGSKKRFVRTDECGGDAVVDANELGSTGSYPWSIERP